ncbi:hypothetical protein XJ32_03025 [Helicobacter bilis]|uniref:Uncharacterized protein n=1 Tax=Helicobacter bilis TaxID=37372 RepID=A0A1Q2LFM6_9HELI|nr:T6SS effector amidase Tae4 family protein [Helicobacter bilis]AQQ59239.1 hypothetical protein XJ32_03025 [Helicobacter bilis]
MYSKNDNIAFRQELQNFKKNGIVVMRIKGFVDAGGHTTLWNGEEFADGTNYLNDEEASIFVRELCFWELL